MLDGGHGMARHRAPGFVAQQLYQPPWDRLQRALRETEQAFAAAPQEQTGMWTYLILMCACICCVLCACGRSLPGRTHQTNVRACVKFLRLHFHDKVRRVWFIHDELPHGMCLGQA